MSSSLFETVQQLNTEYQENKDEIEDHRSKELREKRNQACLEASVEILRNHEDRIREAARKGWKSSRVYDYRHRDQIKFNGCFLKDLLDKGDLLDLLQKALDEKHGDNHFKIYHTVVKSQVYTPSYPNRQYGVYISWDQNKFEEIENLIVRTRERARQSRRYPRQMGAGIQRLPPPGRRGSRVPDQQSRGPPQKQ